MLDAKIQGSGTVEGRYNDAEIEPCPLLNTGAFKDPHYHLWKPRKIRLIPNDVVIKNWTRVGAGAHGEVGRVTLTRGGRECVACLKLYNPLWEDSFERECAAYALLIHRGVTRCIPAVLYQGKLPRWKWQGARTPHRNDAYEKEVLCGLVMEWFEDYEEIKLEGATLRMLEILADTLRMIHRAGVVHRDIEERNILLVRDPETKRARIVWIDFSSAWSGPKIKPLSVIRREAFLDWSALHALMYEHVVNEPLTVL